LTDLKALGRRSRMISQTSAGLAMTDLDIRNAILAALEAEPDVHPSAIGVAVHDGVATLSGRVSSFAEKTAATRAAIRMSGVGGVAEELDVCGEEESFCGDEVIAARIVDFLRATGAAGGVNVRVEASRGWVQLSGAVDRLDQRAAIERYARLGEGVLGVDNRVRLRGRRGR
jgi:osmotically-inducible protein OsmY